ncbi:phosphoribosylformylglycinamidine cyclo-ligase [Halobacteriovorax marinus]|uniref:phosphoribosylformylglycinamidine cyclo-ligase n=1 Tax=Halobacteriovorax marinus TaxID=97084 RepID=UPI003A8CCBE2
MQLSYEDSGVSIARGEEFVSKIKKKVQSTYSHHVHAGVGGFACLYKISDDRFLSAGTDGVGTKVLLAQKFDDHSSIGIDLVAMCVNDILCTGALPMFFMDYIACSSLDIERSSSIIDGIVEGCLQSGCALIGGETAEMPGLYKSNEYDLAGFAVGEVQAKNLLDGSKVREGDYIVSIPSSGAHSNGFSLLRKIFKNDEQRLKSLLKPTRIYINDLKDILSNKELSGLAHITGGGIHNISRINSNFSYQIDSWPDINGSSYQEHCGDIFSALSSNGSISREEQFSTFNMGVGMVAISKEPEQLLSIPGSMVIGRVISGSGRVIF